MSFFFGIGVRMRISEKADWPGREADGSTPVRQKAERGRSGEANSVTCHLNKRKNYKK